MEVDLLLTASCFKSPNNAIRMINSSKFIDGKCLIIITSPRVDDLSIIRKYVGEDALLFLSKNDNIYACRNWGFIYAYVHNIVPMFYCSMDDDIEFTENSHDIIKRLSRDDYSVMTFNNSVQIYNAWAAGYTDNLKNISWMNGDSMFTRYKDNLNYGLPDCLPRHDPLPICSESEYQQRFWALTGKRLLADTEKTFYLHHFRDSSEKIELRDNRIVARIQSGIDFFRTKYPGINLLEHTDINTTDVHGILYNHIKAHPEQAQKHSLYDGLFTDYHEIYNKIKGEYTQV